MRDKIKNWEKAYQGVKIKTLIYTMTILMIIVGSINVVGLRMTYLAFRDLKEEFIVYSHANDSINSFLEASYYLTDQVREYVVNMTPEYMENYFTEVNDIKRLEKALLDDNINKVENLRAKDYLNEAYDFSVEIRQKEIHSMKLISYRMGYSDDEIPAEVAAYKLSEEELGYDAYQLQTAAYYLVFDKDYQYGRSNIDNMVGFASSYVNDYADKRMNEQTEALKRALIILGVSVSLMILLFVGTILCITFFMVKPMWKYTKGIKKDSLLQPSGAFELRNFALVYNAMYRTNEENNKKLRAESQRDPLTGLYNRREYDSVLNNVRKNAQNTALMLIDVDNFKKINDNYGHEMGDRVLRYIAGVLQQYFKGKNDFVFRIGGDEFAVILSDIRVENMESIRKRVSVINHELSLAQDEYPAFSISAGLAFNEGVDEDSLVSHADEALYITKENGRCGCTLYNTVR